MLSALYTSLIVASIIYIWMNSDLPIRLWEFLNKRQFFSDSKNALIDMGDEKIGVFNYGYLIGCNICLSFWLCMIVSMFLSSSGSEFLKNWLASPIIVLGILRWTQEK